ncbi:hypothetical protein TCAL_02047 [Tigriopus californicus]|uniref:Leucine-rich repeat-containing protein 57 n=2 Tax=Tigriopus californicus TaxID=6832 RepID=A0A553NAT9_TIGCA|nr:hypothetical protein TCAL_02047 [Tigriopus californicus]|eukprot:TCALIF_02047-PA protein Name:"Similar to lrrc57 Leucine-rich repeat-containing protein 57 (Xenopus laevis)" AED:0.12 eAED:0.12 QI:0/-1/0/1/-1/1/1/0/229
MDTADKTGALCFSHKKLDKFPVALQKVSGKLRNLDLSHNQLTTLPPWIESFTQLRNLHLNDNRLKALPNELAALVKLESLHVERNHLTALPESLAQLKNLKELGAAQNRLGQFPAFTLTLKKLDTLNLAQNALVALPADMSSLAVLELDLNQNQITVMPDTLARCPRLKTLRMEENCLPLTEVSEMVLAQSSISSLSLSGNLFNDKKLADQPGYDKYLERYTAIRRKLD